MTRGMTLALAMIVAASSPALPADNAAEAQKLMKKLARDKDPEMRSLAASRLGSLKAVEAVPALAAALKDKDPGVRSTAAGALLDMGELAEQARPALQEALLDPDGTTVWNAAGALHNMGVVTTDLMPAYRRLLEDHDCDLRISAAKAISEYAAPAELLPVAIGCREATGGEWGTAAKAKALMDAIARDRAAIPLIADQLRQHPHGDVRMWAAKALGEHGPAAKQAAAALDEALTDEDESVRDAAQRALAKVRPKK